MVLCFASITMLGAGAAKTGKNATEPATGSPWWVVQTINNTINKLSVNLDLDGMSDSDKNMMSYHHAANGAKTNCQDYLYFIRHMTNRRSPTAIRIQATSPRPSTVFGRRPLFARS